MAAIALSKDGWLTTESLAPDTNQAHAKIIAALETAKFEHLQVIALSSRRAADGHTPAGVTCRVNTDSFTFGMNNIVLKLTFSDDVSWVARFQYISPPDKDENGFELLSEVATLRTLRNRTTIPVPQVFAFDVSTANEFGFPYMLMECLKGHTLSSSIARHVPTEHHPRVATQLADVLFQLRNLTFGSLGRLWGGESCDETPRVIHTSSSDLVSPLPRTSLEWFYKQRQAANLQALEKHPGDPQWTAACWILKSAVTHIIQENSLHGPFPLCHFDLHYGNLLFDDEYNLTGVIDWSQTGTAPLERLAVSPEFMTYPGLSEQENRPIVAFRELVRGSLKVLEDQEACKAAGQSKPALSKLIGTTQTEITHRCTYSFPHRAVIDAQLVSRLIYKDIVSWEQLVGVYGEMAVH